MILKNKEAKEHSIVELTVEVTAEEFTEACTRAYRKNAKKITVPGFRKGKAPQKMIERMYGESFFWEDAVNESYSEAYEAALKEADISPVGYPEVEVHNVGAEGYSFTAKVPVKPVVEISDYIGIRAVRPDNAVSEADIDAEVERYRKRNGRIVTAEREIRTGDTAVIDFEGFLNGEAFQGGKGENYNLEIGSGSFIPGFEDQLIGAKAGDELEIALKFPDEYHEPTLAGQDTVFKVKVNEVKELILPELDDEFVKDVSEFDNLEDWRADLRAKQEESLKRTSDDYFETSVMNELASRVVADIPAAMFESQLDTYIENFAYRMRSQGIDLESYLKLTGQDAAALREQFRPQAEQQVKVILACEKVAELEKLEPSEEDLENGYNKLASQYNMSVEQVKKAVEPESLKRDVLMQMAVDFIKSNAIPETLEERQAREGTDKKPDEAEAE